MELGEVVLATAITGAALLIEIGVFLALGVI